MRLRERKIFTLLTDRFTTTKWNTLQTDSGERYAKRRTEKLTAKYEKTKIQ